MRTNLFRRWMVRTCLGWLLGFALTIVLAMAWSLLGVGEMQFMVGLGMGAAVGLAQAAALDHLGIKRGTWVWTSTAGMGVPFVLMDLFPGFVRIPTGLGVEAAVVAGGLLTGMLQRQTLSVHSPRAAWWTPATGAGWGIAGGLALGRLGLPAMLGGGLVLGALTGRALIWILDTSDSP